MATNEDLAALHDRALAIEEGVLAELGLSTAPRRGGPEHAEIKGYVHDGDAVWGAGGEWGEWPEAGYMPDATVTAILRDTLTRYLDGEVSWEAPGDLHMVEAPNG